MWSNPVHRVHVAVVHAEQGLTASAGNPAHQSFVRSAIKMFQVLPFVEAGGVDHFGLTAEELALCVASHGGEPFHVAAARSILAKAKISEAALACGPHLPLHEPTAQAMIAAGEKPGRIHNNCSGKHAGMLACCVCQQWLTNGYHQPTHPMQQRVRSTLERWMRVDPDEVSQARGWLRAADLRAVARRRGRGLRAFAAAAAEGDAGAGANRRRHGQASGIRRRQPIAWTPT